MNTRAALYVRQSLDKAEGIQRQKERTAQLVAYRGWEVADTYSDNDTSASKARGPKTAWGKMLRDAEAGQFTHVVAVDLDRLIRGPRDLLTLIDAKLKIVTVDGEIDLSTADGEFRASMLAAMARFEVRRKSERQVRANVHRASNAKVNPGRRKFGYELGNRVAREEEASWVRWMFKEAQAGSSIRSISLRMKRESAPVGGGVEWTTRRVRDTLMSRGYEGMIIYKGEWKQSPEVEQIIEPKAAAVVRAILSDPARKTHESNKITNMASGLARCGVCGSAMSKLRDYRCRESSAHPSIRVATLDGLIAGAVADAVIFASTGPEKPSVDLSGVVLELQDVRDARARVLALVIQGVVENTDVEQELKSLKKREAELTALQDFASKNRVADELKLGMRDALWTPGVVSITKTAELKKLLVERFVDLPLDRRRELIRTHVTIEVHPGRGTERVKFKQLVATTLN